MLKFADAHCDTITKLRPQQLALGCDTTLAHLDLPRLQEGTQLQFMAFFFAAGSSDGGLAAVTKALAKLAAGGCFELRCGDFN